MDVHHPSLKPDEQFVRQILGLAEDAMFKGDNLNRNFQAKIANWDGALKLHVR